MARVPFPSPMENIPTYCERQKGQRERESVASAIDHILEGKPKGFFPQFFFLFRFYQETGYADRARSWRCYSLWRRLTVLRRAMGKKIAEKWAKERPQVRKKGRWPTASIKRKAVAEVYRPVGKIRQLRFQQIHAAGLCGGHYSGRPGLRRTIPSNLWLVEKLAGYHLTIKLAVYFGRGPASGP